jgi:hypothetical protein
MSIVGYSRGPGEQPRRKSRAIRVFLTVLSALTAALGLARSVVDLIGRR